MVEWIGILRFEPDLITQRPLERRLKPTILLLGLISGAGLASGQVVPPDGASVRPVQTIQSTSTLVTAPTIVRLAGGGLFSGLHAKNFQLTDNGVAQSVQVEPVQKEPIALVVLMQTGGGAPPQFQSYQTLNSSVTSMLGASDHRVGLVTFDSKVQQIWSFPPRIDGLKYAFRNPLSGDHGAVILDALNCGIALLEHQPPALRRVILLLSQARDEGSQVTAEQVLRRLGESNVTVYSVTFAAGRQSSTRRPSRRAKNMLGSADADSSRLGAALKAMSADTAAEAAALTGGECARLSSEDDLDRTISVLASDFADSYVLSFRPISDQPGYHWIRVQVTNPSRRLKVDARSVYWRGEPNAEE